MNSRPSSARKPKQKSGEADVLKVSNTERQDNLNFFDSACMENGRIFIFLCLEVKLPVHQQTQTMQ